MSRCLRSLKNFLILHSAIDILHFIEVSLIPLLCKRDDFFRRTNRNVFLRVTLEAEQVGARFIPNRHGSYSNPA